MQFAEPDAFLVERSFAGHDTSTASDDVEIAFISLLDDDVAGLIVHLLQAHENSLNVRRRNLWNALVWKVATSPCWFPRNSETS